jgi:protease I
MLVAYFLLFILLFAGCVKKEEGGEKKMPTVTGKNVVMIIASNMFRDEELNEPRKILEGQGVGVTIASTSLAPATGMLGTTVKPHKLLSEIKVENFDAIVFVGGQGAAEYWNNPTAHKLVEEALKQNKIVAAICIAPVTLAKAGILKGKRATVFPSEKERLIKEGAIYTGKSVEKDGNIITAAGPEYAKRFGEEILYALGSR